MIEMISIEPVVALTFQIETYIQVYLTDLKLKNLSVSHSENEVESETIHHWSRKAKSRTNS